MQLGSVITITQAGFQQPGLDRPAQSATISTGPFWIQIENQLLQPFINQAVINLTPATSTPGITAVALPPGQTPIGPTQVSYATITFDDSVLPYSPGTSTATQPVATVDSVSTGTGLSASVILNTGLARALAIAVTAVGISGGTITLNVLGLNPSTNRFFQYITNLTITNPIPVFLSFGHGTASALGFTPSAGVQGYATQTLPMMPVIEFLGQGGNNFMQVQGTLVN